MARVFLEDIVKNYGKTRAVDHVTLEVKNGEFVALFGPPGAGKTSILRMIAGLEDVTSGKIWLDDQIVNDLSPAERDVAMVFQTFALYPTKTVFENLAFPLKKRKLPEQEINRRVKEIAEILNIAHLLEKKPGTLSGGERQRVALGRAMVRKPRVFLFDEPLTNLDAKLRLHMRAELKKLQREMGQTAVFSTPDDVEAVSMADRIAVLDRGKLVQYDDVDTIYNKPNCLYVATNIGSPEINTVQGDLHVENNKVILDLGFAKLDLSIYADSLKNLDGKSVIIGVRPHEIMISPSKMDGLVFEGSVVTIDNTGAETYAIVVVNDAEFTVLVPRGMTLKNNEKVWLKVQSRNIHLFDASTGKALT